jgi:hypothetical protein
MHNRHDSARERNKNLAAQRRRLRKYRGRFDFAPTRRREIERHARHVGAADSDDFSRWLIAWVWHNQKSTDPLWALMNATVRMGGSLTEADAREILDEAADTRRRWSADNMARWLGLTFEIRAMMRADRDAQRANFRETPAKLPRNWSEWRRKFNEINEVSIPTAMPMISRRYQDESAAEDHDRAPRIRR